MPTGTAKNPKEKSRKISEANKRNGNIPPTRKGVKYSEKYKKWLSLRCKKHGLGKWMRGRYKLKSNFKQWKGGKTKLQKQIRTCYEYRQWRSDIFTRDDFTCQLCSIRGGELNADHYPKKFSEIIMEYNIKTLQEALKCEELWNINGGRTLCVKCHRETF